MIKLKELVNEVYMHKLYGSDKSHFFVKKPFNLYVASGDMEPWTWSTAGSG